MSRIMVLVAFWPSRIRFAGTAGAAAAAVLVVEELMRRPEHVQVATAFVSSSAAAVPIVLALLLGSIAAVRLAPTDRALGRSDYLRIVGIPSRQLTMLSLARAARDTTVSVAVLILASAVASWVLLPKVPLPSGYEPWPFANDMPVVAEFVFGLWLVGAAWTAAALAHLISTAGLPRSLAGSLAPLLPVLAVGILPGNMGRTVEAMFSPDHWFRDNASSGWWSWAGPPVLWATVAVAASAVAIVLAGRRA